MREFCLVSVLRNFHGLACWLIDSRIALQGVRFTFEPPPHRDAYQVLFTAPALFDTAQTAIDFDSLYLATHPADTHSADALATLLNLFPRTLHRQLKEEGVSLQALKDEVRQARAHELLLRTTRPIKLVATSAGFQNEKSFIRAFKGWPGQTPDEFRRAGVPWIGTREPVTAPVI